MGQYKIMWRDFGQLLPLKGTVFSQVWLEYRSTLAKIACLCSSVYVFVKFLIVQSLLKNKEKNTYGIN